MRSWGQALPPPSIREWADVCGPGEAWEVAQSGRARTPATAPLICLAGPDDVPTWHLVKTLEGSGGDALEMPTRVGLPAQREDRESGRHCEPGSADQLVVRRQQGCRILLQQQQQQQQGTARRWWSFVGGKGQGTWGERDGMASIREQSRNRY